MSKMDVDSFVGIRERALFVGASMIEAPRHPLGGSVTVDLLVGTGNATHGSASNCHGSARS